MLNSKKITYILLWCVNRAATIQVKPGLDCHVQLNYNYQATISQVKVLPSASLLYYLFIIQQKLVLCTYSVLMELCHVCGIEIFIMICRNCCKSSTVHSRLASYIDLLCLWHLISWCLTCFELLWLSICTFLIAAIAAGIGSAAAVLLLVVVITLTIIALLKLKNRGKHTMGSV